MCPYRWQTGTENYVYVFTTGIWYGFACIRNCIYLSAEQGIEYSLVRVLGVEYSLVCVLGVEYTKLDYSAVWLVITF